MNVKLHMLAGRVSYEELGKLACEVSAQQVDVLSLVTGPLKTIARIGQNIVHTTAATVADATSKPDLPHIKPVQ